MSDRIVRKPIISIGIIGYVISLFLFGLASFWTLFIARSLSGILSFATSVASLAYVGDSSLEDEKSKNMIQLGAAMSVGVMIGPVLGGVLAGYSLALPFFTGAGISFIAFILIVTLLPESIEQSVQSRKRESFDFSYLRSMFLGPAGIILILIFVVHFCQTGGFISFNRINPFFAALNSFFVFMTSFILVNKNSGFISDKSLNCNSSKTLTTAE